MGHGGGKIDVYSYQILVGFSSRTETQRDIV